MTGLAGGVGFALTGPLGDGGTSALRTVLVLAGVASIGLGAWVTARGIGELVEAAVALVLASPALQSVSVG